MLFLSFLKVRTSYGLTGNAGIGNFGHLGLYGVNIITVLAVFYQARSETRILDGNRHRQIDFGLDLWIL